MKTSSQVDTSVKRSKLLESEETLPSLTLDISREAGKYHLPGENQVVASLNTDSSNTVLKKLEKLNTEKEERQKQLQQQNEREMMKQICKTLHVVLWKPKLENKHEARSSRTQMNSDYSGTL